MSKYSLKVEHAGPCMKCGSVQCSFCSEDVKNAIRGLKKELCKEMLPRWMIVDLIDKWFPVFKEEEEKTKP